MKKFLLATAVMTALSGTVLAEDAIKVGVVLGYTGPIESLTPDMAASAELAFKEASDSGALLGGKKIEPIRADSTCVDAAAAQAAADRLVTSEKVVAIVGAACSGASTAVANSVAVPNGVPMISPSSTSPALSTIDDKGFFFRTAPSDARQGDILAAVVKGRGIENVAITYTNNDYGKGLSDAFSSAYEKLGGKIAINASHEDGKADYSAEVAALSASGANELVVLGYVDQGGKGIIQTSLDTGAFQRFIMADGMIGQGLIDAIGDDLAGSFGTLPGGADASAWQATAKAGGIADDGDGPYRGESYDAGALIVLAMQAAGAADRAKIQEKIMDVANAPGEKILAGELEKGLKLLAEGKDIDYVGATNVELLEVGEVAGTYKEVEVKDSKFETIKVH